MLNSHNPSFPLNGDDLDLATYYRMSPTQQSSAREWLTKNGTADQKEAFRLEQERFQKENAERDKREEAKLATLHNMQEAPQKHGRKRKPSPGSKGSCNIL